MADKKRMSVAEMLAAARKADGGDADASDEAQAPEQTASPAEQTSASQAAESQAAGPSKVPPPGSADRPSVADILAKARTGKSGGEEAPAKPEAKKPPAKPAAKKPAAAKAAVGATATATAPSEPRDTASILAAARKKTKAGPMSKGEAAAKAKADPVSKEKPKVVVPPMPEKPAYAKAPVARKETAKPSADETRRSFLGLGFWMLGGATALWGAATLKFMFPNVLREPPSKFKVGFPDAFPPGQVQTKYIPQFGVWVANYEYNGEQQIYALKAVCTHLGCTPNWLEAEQKFKCPCHGSGFYKDGINFEGPAPRPLERYAIHVAADGQIEIDKSRIFQEEMGQWQDPASYIPV